VFLEWPQCKTNDLRYGHGTSKYMLNADSVSNKAREMCDSKFVPNDFFLC